MNYTTAKEQVWENIKIKSKAVESRMNPLERKRTGSYYTDLELTDVMMNELVKHLLSGPGDIWDKTFLEPCVGAGNFVFSYLKEISNLHLSKDQIIQLINNIYVADINSHALYEYTQMLTEFVKEHFDIELDKRYFDNHIGSGLLFDVSSDTIKYIDLREVFSNEVAEKGFDIVVTNPPYKNLKAESGHYEDNEQYEIDKTKYSKVAKLATKEFKYATEGVLNLYKLFVEEIVDRYANKSGYVSLLIPASILSDKTSTKLRTHILKDTKLISIKVIGEGSGYIDAQQALCAMLINKGSQTTKINIIKDFDNKKSESADVCIEDIMNENTGNAIVAVNEEEYAILRKLREFPVVKDIPFIINLRGELDLTASKKAVVKHDTGYRLLRGRNIGYYFLNDTAENDFVSEDFVSTTKKKCYIHEERIICQQIANIHKERRVTFALANKNNVLGNSCNFISVKDNDCGIDIYALLGLFNTKIINWLFKLTSSNNHINNYEIASFPVPINSSMLTKISEMTKQYLSNRDEALINKIEECAQFAYGLKSIDKEDTANNKDNIIDKYLADIQYIIPSIDYHTAVLLLNKKSNIAEFSNELKKFEKVVAKNITEKYIKMQQGYILNHTTFKLSDLDLEMIKNVPQGGSWKDIPEETVQKSKRLVRISQTGGRTTLYGRIDYSKPSYTITTYFNRPGNGTYVHPIHERVISVREAARFQSFPDDYFFCGNKTDMLKQVGNAVPVLLAYNIGKAIRDRTGCSTSVDLFSGAGGMTYGFKRAGINAVIANDIVENACVTLKTNSPEIPVLCGDITDDDIKKQIIDFGVKAGADIICGGPPCQGFSLAGFRMKDDPRNELFRHFVDIVSGVNPKVIVFENVEGILSYQGGETYRNITELFSELGYNTEGRKLMANYYGAPQRRKRVIILCTRKDMGLLPQDIFPEPITPNMDRQINAYETIYDLEEVECGENAKYISDYSSHILKYLKNEIDIEEYVKSVVDSRGILEILNLNKVVAEDTDDATNDCATLKKLQDKENLQLSLFEYI